MSLIDRILFWLYNLIPIEKLRLRFARYIDDKYSQACWANLVIWAFRLNNNKDWNDQECKTFAWCGKCRVLGKLEY